MNILRDRVLAKRFCKKKVTQKEQLLYLILLAIIFGVATSSIFNFYMWSSSEYLTLLDYLADVTVLAFGVITLLLCYRINKSGDNEDFIARFTCLSLPVSIQAFIISIPATLPAVAYSLYVGPSLEEVEAMDENTQIELSTPEELMFFIGMLIPLLYALWRLRTAMKIASGQT